MSKIFIQILNTFNNLRNKNTLINKNNFIKYRVQNKNSVTIQKIINWLIVIITIFGSFTVYNKTFAQQQVIHVNEQQYRWQYYSGSSWGNWNNWIDGIGNAYSGYNYGYNYFANIANLITDLGTNNLVGGIVELCTDVKGDYTHNPGSSSIAGVSYNYRSGWNYGALTTSAGGDLNINAGHTVTLLNKLNGIGTSSNRLTITTMNKNNEGTLVLDYASPAGTFYLNSTTFSGNNGTFIIGNVNSVQYTSTNTIVGSLNGFNATVNTGSTWNAGTLTARNIFNINGNGNTNATSTTISGTTTSNITNFNTGSLFIGVTDGDGNFIVNAGNVNSTTANIANNDHNGTIQLNGAGVIWTTSDIANIGDTGTNKTGTVDIVNGTWNANNMVNIASAVNGNGVVNIKGTSVWNAVNQSINIGLNGIGVVNQSGGTWINNNSFIGVNNGSRGYVEQSGGVHKDHKAVVGVSGNAVANIFGNGTQWITDDQNAAANNAAIIGQDSTADGKVSVYDNATWAIGNTGNPDNLITGDSGIGTLRVFTNAKVNIAGDHIIANDVNSYGSDQVDGAGSVIDIAGNMIVADRGNAGGRYVYYPEGTHDPNYADYFNNGGKTAFGENSLGGGFYKDPIIWFDSPNLNLRPIDSNWIIYKENASGLAITSGGIVKVRGAIGAKVANQIESYAYILLDSKDAVTISTWNIDSDLTMGVSDRTNDNLDDAYMRITNGSLVSVGGQAVIASGAGTEVTVRINGSQGSNNATLETTGNLIVARGINDGDTAESNLYVYDKGKVEVGKGSNANMTIADTNKTFGRVHVDGTDSMIVVNGLLTVANEGYAGNKYKYISDNKPNNDNFADPSYNEKWFDSLNTLSDLNTAGGVNDNAPGLLITRNAVVSSQSGNVATAENSYAYVVIDGKDAAAEATKWTITDADLTIADNGEAYVRIINGGLLETKNTTNGNIIIANDDGSIATVRVLNNGSKIDAASDLIIAKLTGSDGQLFVYDRAAGHVGGSVVIADGADTNAQVQIDGAGTKLEIDHRLTVGNWGNAGGYFNENRYDPAIATNPNTVDRGYRVEPYNLTNPSNEWWFDSPNMNLRNNKNYEGNAPGLAITDGGVVVANSGVIAARSRDGLDLDSIGYVLIDNHYGFNGSTGRQGYRSTLHIKEIVGGTNDQNGDLIIGREGKGFVRVLNGGLLEIDGHTKLNSRIDSSDTVDYVYAGVGSLYVFGNGGSSRAAPNSATAANIPNYVTPYDDGNRSTWISHKATILGDTGDYVKGGEATIRINNGAYGETYGIYAGYSEDARGDVSVMGKASELHIYKDTQLGTAGYDYSINDIKGSGGLSVSNQALLQLHNEGNITLNGMSLISHNSLLHLDDGSILDSRKYSNKVVNARVEGSGTITAENGVTFLYDSTYADSMYDPVYASIGGKFETIVSKPTATQIDPGLYYGWEIRHEYYERYGTLTFGDRLTLVGNVTTFFDVNSGWRVPNDPLAPGAETNQLNDMIVVKRGDSSTSTADIIATLSGTLKIHARLTRYFVDEPSFQVVKTEGDDKNNQFVPGRITRQFDKLEIVPWRFFEDPHQEIRRDADGNDSLWISMKRKKNPFEESGHSYNEKSTGRALDDIYNKRYRRWLPVLRYFWYLDDSEFLDAYRTLSGEIHAHSLLLPLQNPWTYNQNRFDFKPCLNKSHNHGYDKVEQIDPCKMTEMANNFKCCDSYCGKLRKYWDKCKKDLRLWGNYIYDQSEYDSDGNAGAFNLNRNGVVFGFDKPTSDGNQYFGLQCAFVKGELDAFLSEVKVDDFNIGLYHGKKIHRVFEWRNFLGMGIENYKTKRTLSSGLAYYDWLWDTPDGSPSTNPADGHYHYNNENYNGNLRSKFNGYALYANTEIARPFILGSCNQYMIRPYTALDLISVWQNSASEKGDFRGSDFVQLDFLSAALVRVYGRTGIMFERNGDHINLNAGLSYNFQMGGRHYSNVDNKFQVDNKSFNIRSVDVGNDFLNLNCGAEWYFGKKKNQFVMINYQALFGKNITTQSAQLGYQYKF
ncbi:MAG: hypothetical protein LBC74_01290 [Planctomycetaceae bacterium]|jgi:hypothetical protein|nr:hypothetical protein [Planctomycetaceae bacterium]